MNYLILILTMLASTAFGQVKLLDGQYPIGISAPTNYALNPYCTKDARNYSISGGTKSKNITNPLNTGLGYDCQWTATAANQTMLISLKAFDPVMKGGNCQVTMPFKTNIAGFMLQAARGATPFGVATTIPLTSTSTQPAATLNFPCGDLSVASSLIVTAPAAGTINWSGLQVGLATNLFQASPDTVWTNYGTNVITGTTTAPTKGTVAVDRILGARVGPNALIRIEYGQTTAGTAGSGDYLYDISKVCPGVDLNQVTLFTSLANSGSAIRGIVGQAQMGVPGAAAGLGGVVTVYDSTHVRLSQSSTDGTTNFTAQGSGFYQFSNTTLNIAANFSVPCAGWAPQTAINLTNSNFDNANWALSNSNGAWGTIAATNPGKCVYGRDNKYMTFECHFTTTAPTAAEAQINLPAGLTTDSSYDTTTGEATKVGDITAPVNSDLLFVCASGSKAYLNICMFRLNAYYGAQTQGATSAFGAGTAYISGRVKIQQWSQNANMPVLIQPPFMIVNALSANADAEVSSLGWVTYNDGAATAPVDGVGGTVTGVTLTRSTVAPLRGMGSFVLSKDANTRQGMGASFDFPIDPADTNKSLTLSFDWLASNSNFFLATGTTDSDVEWFIYDKANNALVGTSSAKMFASPFVATFRSSSSTQYRLIAHVATVNGYAWDLKFDNLLVTPTLPSLANADTGMAYYSPTYTGFGTPPLSSCYWSRTNDRLNWDCTFTAGSSTAVTAAVSLPSGLTMTSFGATRNVGFCGYSSNGSSGAVGAVFSVIAAPGSNFFNFGLRGSGTNTLGAATGSALLNPGDTISCQASVPIAGWTPLTAINSSNANTDWANSGANVVTATTTNPTKGSTNYDNLFWKRDNGNLKVRIEFSHSSAGVAGSGDYLWSIANTGCLIDGTKTSFNTNPSTLDPDTRGIVGTGFMSVSGSSAGYAGIVTAYDATHLRLITTNNQATGQYLYEGGSQFGFNIAGLRVGMNFEVPCSNWPNAQNAPQLFPTYAANYYSTSSVTLPTGGATIKIPLNSVTVDTAGSIDAVNNRYLVKANGTYQIFGQIGYSATNATGGCRVTITKNVTQTTISTKQEAAQADNSQDGATSTYSIVKLNVGDYLEMYGGSTYSTRTTNTSSVGTYMTVQRIGD